jgi:hypothetical protein
LKIDLFVERRFDLHLQGKNIENLGDEKQAANEIAAYNSLLNNEMDKAVFI